MIRLIDRLDPHLNAIDTQLSKEMETRPTFDISMCHKLGHMNQFQGLYM